MASKKQIKSSNFTDNLYKSRKTLIKYLEREGYDCENYESFSANDVHMMQNFNTLDMLLSKKENEDSKVFVKYHLEGVLKNSIYDYIEELYRVEDVLKGTDNFIIVLADVPNDNTIQLIKNIFDQDGIFITLLNVPNMMFNILEHKMVPPHRKLTEEEKQGIMKKYNISRESEFPQISRFDPVAQVMFMRPGDVCEITRYNKTSIVEKYYRLCIPK